MEALAEALAVAEALVEAPAEGLQAAEAPAAEAPAADLPAADLPAAAALAEVRHQDIPDLLLLEEEVILVLDGPQDRHRGPLEALEQEELYLLWIQTGWFAARRLCPP